MNNNLIGKAEKYKSFLKVLEKEISEKDFKEKLLKIQKIDLNHYTKNIKIEDFKNYIQEYKEEKYKENEFNNFLVLLPGNPEIVFKLCLEAIRYNVNMKICIEDFCLTQNTFIVEKMNQVIKECNLIAFYDNTESFRRFAICKNGEVVRVSRNVPDWFSKVDGITIN